MIKNDISLKRKRAEGHDWSIERDTNFCQECRFLSTNETNCLFLSDHHREHVDKI